MVARLKEHYRKEIVGALTNEFNYKNVMEVPCLVKVVVNMGVGDAIADAKNMDAAIAELAQITG
ncbi:MAG TPA: 50S ribosomal protein L5, partial [Candidatus Hydrogenedentes bacterium]|nr:50S ribosomal protein L5 [Candidatus Hydrogenedentota bacterium]